MTNHRWGEGSPTFQQCQQPCREATPLANRWHQTTGQCCRLVGVSAGRRRTAPPRRHRQQTHVAGEPHRGELGPPPKRPTGDNATDGPKRESDEADGRPPSDRPTKRVGEDATGWNRLETAATAKSTWTCRPTLRRIRRRAHQICVGCDQIHAGGRRICAGQGQDRRRQDASPPERGGRMKGGERGWSHCRRKRRYHRRAWRRWSGGGGVGGAPRRPRAARCVARGRRRGVPSFSKP